MFYCLCGGILELSIYKENAMGIFKSLEDLSETVIELQHAIKNNIEIQESIYADSQTSENLERLENMRMISNRINRQTGKLVRGRKMFSFMKYVSTFAILILVIVLTLLSWFLLVHTHLNGYGAKQFVQFDWISLLINLSKTIPIALIISELFLFINALIEDWITDNKIRNLLKNFGYIILLTFTVGSVVVSFTFSMNSDQLSITASVIAFFAIFEFVFRRPLKNFVNLSNYFYQRIQKKFFNRNRPNK